MGRDDLLTPVGTGGIVSIVQEAHDWAGSPETVMETSSIPREDDSANRVVDASILDDLPFWEWCRDGENGKKLGGHVILYLL